jgi:hypothetical protein
MSYDIHCYRSKIGKPDLEEAQESMEVDDSESEEQSAVKFDIAKALTDFNPRLEAFKLDYNEIAKLHDIAVEDAKAQFNYIELNPPDGDLVIQITINNDNVSLTIPYWYGDEQARQVFKYLMEYLRIIRKTSGYFVYDPQTDQVFDPLTTDLEGLDIYLQTTKNISKAPTRPWWKIW